MCTAFFSLSLSLCWCFLSLEHSLQCQSALDDANINTIPGIQMNIDLIFVFFLLLSDCFMAIFHHMVLFSWSHQIAQLLNSFHSINSFYSIKYMSGFQHLQVVWLNRRCPMHIRPVWRPVNLALSPQEFSSSDFRSNSVSSRTPTPPGCYSPHSPVDCELSVSPRRR